jgi:hypothetical protein
MFSVGDAVTIKSDGMYDDCSCEFCAVMLAGGYGIVQDIDERDNSDDGPICKLVLYDKDGVLFSSSPYRYRFGGIELFHNTNKSPDWEV